MIRLFEGASHASVYKKYRPITYPEVVRTILDFMEEKLPSGGQPYDLALDVGCGSGQHTVSLAPYFRSVLGSDISEAQVEEGRNDPSKPSNVSYSLSPAEDLSSVASCSVQLVTGGTSIHWLDLPKFYVEVNRVLVPNGVMAAVTQIFERVVHPTKTKELNESIMAFRANYLDDKLSEKLATATNYYRDLPLPYPDELRIEKMIFTEEKNVAYLIGTINAYSTFQTFLRMDPEKATGRLIALEKELLSIMGYDASAEDTPLTLEFRYSFAMSRKPE